MKLLPIPRYDEGNERGYNSWITVETPSGFRYQTRTQHLRSAMLDEAAKQTPEFRDAFLGYLTLLPDKSDRLNVAARWVSKVLGGDWMRNIGKSPKGGEVPGKP